MKLSDALKMTQEDFASKMDEIERQKSSTWQDSALEQFVRKPNEKSNLCDNVIAITDFILLFILFCIIFASSLITGAKGMMEPYISIPIANLSFIGTIILIKSAKKHDDENKKKYK